MAERVQEPKFYTSGTRKHCLPLKGKNGMSHLSLSPNEKISKTPLHLFFQGVSPIKLCLHRGTVQPRAKALSCGQVNAETLPSVSERHLESNSNKKIVTKEDIPHNPFPDKQTLDFQIPHLLQLRDTLKCLLCEPPVEMKW